MSSSSSALWNVVSERRFYFYDTHKLYFVLLQAAQDSYSDLDNRLFSSYIEQKSDPILGVMEPNMYRGGFNWKTWKNPTGVRNYLKEIIMSLTEVHAEVFSIK